MMKSATPMKQNQGTNVRPQKKKKTYVHLHLPQKGTENEHLTYLQYL